jgi:hypothetical protein
VGEDGKSSLGAAFVRRDATVLENCSAIFVVEMERLLRELLFD